MNRKKLKEIKPLKNIEDEYDIEDMLELPIERILEKDRKPAPKTG